jgi:peptidoglycan-associated lipoprotein
MMNHRPNQPISSEPEKTKRPSLQTGVEQSDSKEMLFLAAGLITLTLGLGGLFMYSDDETLPVTASQEATEEVSTFQMAKAFATPSPSPGKSVPSSPLTTEPSLSLVSHSSQTQESEDTNVYFEFDHWALSEGAKNLLKTQIHAQGEEWTGTLHIDGHTDAQGTDSYNRALGLKRAEAVKAYLISLGISDDRITVKSFGKDSAVCQDQTPDCFEHNRRAHVAFLSQPADQQDDTLLSMTPDAPEDSASEVSSPMMASQATEVAEDEIAVQEEIPGELVAVDPAASAESLP